MNSHLTWSYYCVCTRVLGYRCKSSVFTHVLGSRCMSKVFLSCSLTFFLFFFFHIFLLVCESTCTLLPWPAGKGQVRGQLAWLRSLLLPRGAQGWNSGLPASQQEPLLAEQSPWPSALLLELELVDVARQTGWLQVSRNLFISASLVLRVKMSQVAF